MNHNHHYRWIAFDAVGTLIRATPPAGEIYHRVGRQFGSRLAAEEIARRFGQALRDSDAGDSERVDATARLVTSESREKQRWQEIVAAVIDDVTDTAACFAELFEHFARSGSWSCFDEVPVALAELQAKGFRLAIASNFDSRLHAVCDGLAALREIDLRIISSEVGCRKPGRAFFEALVARTGCKSSEVLMVGDDAANDIAGARKAGLGAILINRRGSAAAGEIGNLVELLDLLERSGGADAE